MKEGIYDNIPEEVYHSSEGISKSQLDHMINGSPLHYQYALNNKTETTPAMRFGSLFHMVTLEPERVASEVVIAKKFDKRKKGQKEAEEEFLKENEGKLIVSQDDMDTVSYMRDAAYSHGFAKDLLTMPSKKEQSIYSIDKDTDLLKRGRIDIVNDHEGVLTDLKSCQDASPRGFKKSIYQYNYHVQESYYKSLYHEQTNNTPKAFYFIAVEKTPPFGVGVYTISFDLQVLGMHEYKEALRKVKQCMDLNQWPSYEDGAVTIGE